jgi:undecaprenyl-diphosphatase
VKHLLKLTIPLFLLFTSNYSSAQNWDVETLHKINPSNPNSTFWKTASSSTYPVSLLTPATLLSVGYYQKDKQLIKKGWAAVGTLAINTAITQGLKYGINRTRPYISYPNLIHTDVIENDPSFPSGHTSTAFATAANLSIQFNNKWYVAVPAYAWATSVGYSRLYLGKHYPSDVLAGAAIGIGAAYLNNWLQQKCFPKKYRH